MQHYACLLILSATYQRFDGILLPEHIIKPQKVPENSGNTIKEAPTTCNGVKLSSFNYKTEDLSLANHKELRKKGLSMHLQSMHNALAGTESLEDPIHCVEMICATYFSLHKYFLYFKIEHGYFGCQEWKFPETTKVHIVYLYRFILQLQLSNTCIHFMIV